MSEENGRNSAEEQKKSLDSLRRSWAQSDIQRRAQQSKKKLDVMFNSEKFEQELRNRTEKNLKERERIRSKRNADASEDAAASVSAYEAKLAVKKHVGRKKRREGFIHRSGRLLQGFSDINKSLAGREYVTVEQEIALKREVLWDAWNPLCTAASDALNTFWDFACKLGRDTCDIILFVADVFIWLGYYIGSLFMFLGDVCWDIWFFAEKNKRKLFAWFSSVLTAAAMVAIIISSVSAFEYSYYGRKLGTAKSKQEVYRTIEVLGDKLSEATGANVNVDIERDIVFNRIFGFRLDVDSSDQILNTITYMKDLQADAFAVNVDGQTAVIMESEDAAKKLIENYRSFFAGAKEGVEYNSVSFKEIVTIEPAQVLLGDIWNSGDALSYMTTGKTEPLVEGEEAHPLITVYSLETATVEEPVDYDIEYITNSALYMDEEQLYTAGVKGKDEVVMEISRINGVEQERTILSSTRISNPINAVYYKGTKPIPDSKGTGYFIFPLKDPCYFSAYYGEQYGVVGVSEYHGGCDFAIAIGSHVYAADGGIVTFAGYAPGYGYMVQIDHGGLYETIYGHLDEIFVHENDIVYQGKHIANSGNTGISTGPHLHFEVRYKGSTINPLSVVDLPGYVY